MQQRTRGRAWMRLRAKIIAEQGYACAACARMLDGAINRAEVDHVTPLHKGGTDERANLRALCHDCHAVKTAADMGWTRKPLIRAKDW